MRDVPEDKKKEIISRWLSGEAREKIATSIGLTSSIITGVINEWKRDLGAAIADAYRGADERVVGHGANPPDIIHAFRLMLMLDKLGIDAESTGAFLSTFSKVVLSTGVKPEGLANIVKHMLKLAELDGIEIYQIPAQVETLLHQKQELEAEIEELRQEKENIHREVSGQSPQTFQPSAPQQQGLGKGSGEKDTHAAGADDREELLSEFGALRSQLEENGLSLTDVAAFTQMISNSKKHGYDFASILDLVSSLKLLEQEKTKLSSELNRLRDSEAMLSQKQRAIAEKLSKEQSIIDSIEKLKDLGFEPQDFESIYDCISRVAELEGIDPVSASAKFFNDLKDFYDSEGLRKKSIQQPPPKYEGAENKELVEMLQRLTSKGVTEQTLMKCVIINDLFKLDLDSLADDLKNYRTLKDAASQAIDTRARLESEELAIKHKLVALEEQRERMTSSMKEFTNSEPEIAISGLTSPDNNEEQLHEFKALAKALRGESVDLDQLKISLNLVIDTISNILEPQSLTKKILDHAKLALEHERSAPRNRA